MIHSPRINHSMTIESPSQSPPSFENLAPMKTIQPTSSYMHTMNVYEHSSATFEPHSSRVNF